MHRADEGLGRWAGKYLVCLTWAVDEESARGMTGADGLEALDWRRVANAEIAVETGLKSDRRFGPDERGALRSPIGHTPRYFKSIFERGSVFCHRRPLERFGSSGDAVSLRTSNSAGFSSRPNTVDHTAVFESFGNCARTEIYRKWATRFGTG